ncbi:MAG: carboxypeptidase-like regulatory domain-containing protein [Myxococcota bacterium]
MRGRGLLAVVAVLVLALGLGVAAWLALDGGSAPSAGGAAAPAAPKRAPADRHVSGFVRDAMGRPVAGAEVRLLPSPQSLERCAQLLDGCPCAELAALASEWERSLAPLETTRTAADGSFFLATASAGQRLVAVTPSAAASGELRRDAETELELRPARRRVVDAAGAPVPGALVVALDPLRRVAALGRADARGELVLPPFDSVLVLAEGFVPRRRFEASGRPLLPDTPDLDGVDGEGGPDDESDDGDVSEGPSAKDWLEARQELELERAKFISGIARGADGRPIAGARLAVLSERAGRLRCADGVTGADGSWRLGPLPGGAWRLLAESADGARRATKRLELRDEETDAGLALEEPVAVDVRVVDEAAGKPVPGAVVQVRSFARGERGTTETLEEVMGLVDERGHFSASLTAGELSLKATHPDYSSPLGPFGVTRPGPAGGRVVELLVLARSIGVRGWVEDPSGAPIADADVRCTYSRVGRFGSESARTGADGAFFVECAAGRVEVLASATGFLPHERQVVAPAEGVRLTLSRGGGVRGRVVDHSGALVRDVSIELRREDDERRYTTTSEDGTFEVLGELDDGAWLAFAEQRGSRPAGERLGMRPWVAQAGSTRFEVRGGGVPFVEIRLDAARTISGQVVDASGRGVAGVGVLATAQYDPTASTGKVPRFLVAMTAMNDHLLGMQVEVTTDANGRFSLGGLGAVPYTLLARAPGLREDPRALAVIEPGTTDAVVRVVRDPVVRGVVCDETGAPLQAFRVESKKLTSADGTFAVTRPLAGDASILVEADGRVPVQVDVRLEWDEVRDLGEVRLRGGRSLEVTAVDAVTGHVEEPWFRIGEVPLAYDEKRHVLEGVPLGAFSLRVVPNGFVPQTVPVDASATTLTIRLERGATVEGHFAGPLVPGQGAWLLVGGEKLWAPVNDKGDFTIEHAPAGSGVVRVEGTGGRVLGDAPVTVPASGRVEVVVGS